MIPQSPPAGTLHHVELWVPDLSRAVAMSAPAHDRLRPGLNHLAFHAGGPGHYAAYLSNADGYEVELVADDLPAP
jgi:hypothetical protein